MPGICYHGFVPLTRYENWTKILLTEHLVVKCRNVSNYANEMANIVDPDQTAPAGAVVVVVALLFYVHGKHLRSCRDGQLT